MYQSFDEGPISAMWPQNRSRARRLDANCVSSLPLVVPADQQTAFDARHKSDTPESFLTRRATKRREIPILKTVSAKKPGDDGAQSPSLMARSNNDLRLRGLKSRLRPRDKYFHEFLPRTASCSQDEDSVDFI